MVDKKGEEKEGLKSYIISFIFSSLCSIAIPVALSFYFVPERSWEYFEHTVQDQLDGIREIRWENIYNTILDVLKELPPMFETEKGVLLAIGEAAPPALTASFNQFTSLDYRIIIALALFVLIFGFIFMKYWWKACKEWILNVLWGSVCVVAGFLPIDSGMDVLDDKEAGPYKMIVMVGAVALMLITNYIVVVSLWWIFTFSLSYLWRSLFGRSKEEKAAKKKKEVKPQKKEEKKKVEKKVEKKKPVKVQVEEEEEEEEEEKVEEKEKEEEKEEEKQEEPEELDELPPPSKYEEPIITTPTIPPTTEKTEVPESYLDPKMKL